MKRIVCLTLAILLFIGCGQKVIQPSSSTAESTGIAAATDAPTPAMPQTPTATITPTASPVPILPTPLSAEGREHLFPEELLTAEGDPIRSEIRSLLMAEGLTREAYRSRFDGIIQQIDTVTSELLRLSEIGRTLTANRKEQVAEALHELTGESMLSALEDAYGRCSGTGEELTIESFRASADSMLQTIARMEDRTASFFASDDQAAKEYRTVLGRYMGEPFAPDDAFDALEALIETCAYGIGAAMQADPEVVRRKDPISLGDPAENMALLFSITNELCPLPDGASLPAVYLAEGERGMDLLRLAYITYPGSAFLQVYAEYAPEGQRARWANAPKGYLWGVALHNAYTVTPYLEDFGLDYVQYRWYEELLYRALTGIAALQIHYYGYTKDDVADYLKSWGAEEFADYLYENAMSDPFDSVVVVYGYSHYLEICQAALDAGCENEQRFLRDYLAVGPAPFRELKEYMVNLYQNQG